MTQPRGSVVGETCRDVEVQMAEHQPEAAKRAERSDHSPWNWLLLLPLAVTLYPPLYNRESPDLFGIPFFYWYQMVAIGIGVTCTIVVYRMTRR
jgi:hypothetical protein